MQCLASFISQTGLLRSVHLYFLRGLFTLWSRQQLKPWFGADSVATELDGAVADLDPVLREVTIKALVVYDTVSALGVPNPFTPRPMSFVGNQVPKIVEHAFQALALDERRAAFEPVIWKSVEEDDKGTPTVMKQCWFLGSHADVGGNGDAALGALTLLWAVGLLRKHTGVTLDEGEIMRHLKHRLLEWEVRIHPAWRVLKEKSKLSTISSSGEFSCQECTHLDTWYLLAMDPVHSTKTLHHQRRREEYGRRDLLVVTGTQKSTVVFGRGLGQPKRQHDYSLHSASCFGRQEKQESTLRGSGDENRPRRRRISSHRGLPGVVPAWEANRSDGRCRL